MTDSINNGGPAFPHQFQDVMGHPDWRQSTGMTMRDWFAGQAMAGICAHQDTWRLPDVPTVCRQAYHIADAMLEARK